MMQTATEDRVRRYMIRHPNSRAVHVSPDVILLRLDGGSTVRIRLVR